MSEETNRPAPQNQPAASLRPRRSLSRRAAGIVVVVVAWAAAAYLIMPRLWEHYTHRHPSLEDIPSVIYTADGIPGDPLNVALVGTKQQVMKLFVAAKWYPADPLTLKSCLE